MRFQYSNGILLPESSQLNSDGRVDGNIYSPHSSTRYINVSIDDQSKKVLPELYDKREHCCGCSACYSICPANAIIMEPCEEGFLYPVVNAKSCIRCYKCLSVCVFKRSQAKKLHDI